MTNFFATEDTVTVYLDDEQRYWVELKRELDYSEEGELQGASIQAGLNADGTPKLEFSLRAMRNLRLALYVADWNLTGGNGKVIPLPSKLDQRAELLGHLAPKWGETLARKIDELRGENGDQDAVKLPEEAEGNPTSGGGSSALETRSPSPNGSGPVTATFSGRLSA